MSERFTKLFSLPENLYAEDCPVMICAGALSKDNQTNKVFVQLRFQNIDSRFRTLVAVKVAIQAFDVTENTLGGAKEYQYLDIEIQRGAEFGSKQPVYLENATARSFSVSILEVVFAEEGQVWTGENGKWISLKQNTLEETLGSAMAEQYRRDTFGDAKYEILANSGVWLCACGTFNTIEESSCCRCHNSKVELFKALDHTVLAHNLEAYTTTQNVAQKKRNKKKKIISVLGVLLCFVVLTVGVITSQNIKKEKMEDAIIGYIYPGVDVFAVIMDEGTFMQVNSITGSEWIGQWKVISVSGNTMRISFSSGAYGGEHDVSFEKENEHYRVISIKRTGEPYRDWGSLKQIK